MRGVSGLVKTEKENEKYSMVYFKSLRSRNLEEKTHYKKPTGIIESAFTNECISVDIPGPANKGMQTDQQTATRFADR
jgi:hypothetical protein